MKDITVKEARELELKCIKQLKEAFQSLNNAIEIADDVDENNEDLISSQSYPFDKSFDELNIDVMSWYEDMKNVLGE